MAADIELAGYVGEPRNKKLAYLIGTSRRLSKPLSAIFRAQSGCGKSFLMETVAELMPPEDVHYFSRLTPQALYYLEPDALTHKLLIVDERDGSEEAEYPIRTLQTRRVLKLAVPIKDPNSGKIKTDRPRDPRPDCLHGIDHRSAHQPGERQPVLRALPRRIRRAKRRRSLPRNGGRVRSMAGATSGARPLARPCIITRNGSCSR